MKSHLSAALSQFGQIAKRGGGIKIQKGTAWIVLIILIMAAFLLVPFSSKSDVNTLPGNQEKPSAALGPDGTIYVVYQDDRNFPDAGDIYLAKSIDGGQTFGDPSTHILVYNDDPSYALQAQPAIDVDSNGTIHIVFILGAASNLYYTSSSDGLNFANPLIVTDAPLGTLNVAQYPTLKADVDHGRVYIGWRDGRDITNGTKSYYCVGNISDGIPEFSENKCLYWSPNSTVKQSTPSIAYDSSGTVYFAWHDNRSVDLNVYYAVSHDLGESLEFPGAIEDDPAADQGQPSIAVDSMGRLFAAYSVDTSGDGLLGRDSAIAVSVRGFNDTFGASQNITSFSGGNAPEIDILDGGLIFLVYSEEVEAGQDVYRGIFYISSLNGGGSWNSPTQVDERRKEVNNMAQCIVPEDTGNVTLIWEANDFGDRNIVSYRLVESLPQRMRVSITPSELEAPVGQNITFEIRAMDGAVSLASCTVLFASDSGGSFSAVIELGDGYYSTNYTVPNRTAGTNISIMVEVAKSGYPDSGALARLTVVVQSSPVAVISGDTLGQVGFAMNFNGSGSFDVDGTIVLYYWDFGDGSNATGQAASHSYNSSRTYNVTLTVTDDEGLNGSVVLQVDVQEIIPEFEGLFAPIISILLLFILFSKRRLPRNRKSRE